MSPRLRLELEQDRYAAGETVRGTVHVLEGGHSRSLRVLLRYNEATKDYHAVGTIITADPIHEGELTTGASFPFSLELPLTALPNYQSANGELYWDVRVEADEFGRDTSTSCRIEVEAPRRPGSGLLNWCSKISDGVARFPRFDLERRTALVTGASRGIRHDLAPGIPAGRVGTTMEAAAAVIFFASPAASLVNGAVLAVDGGWTAP